MSKIRVVLKDPDKLEYEILSDDPKKGDTFNISELQDADISVISKQVDKNKKEIISQLYEENKADLMNELKAQDNDYQTYKSYYESKENIEKTIKLETEKKLEENYAKIISQLNQELATEKQKLISAISEYKNTEEYQDLIKNKNDFATFKETSDLKFNEKLAASKLEATKAFIEEKEDLKNKIKQLEERRSKLSVKDIGEELEAWIISELDMYSSALNIRYYKTTTTEDKTKPDFKIEILDPETNSELSSIIIEAKSEALNSKTKTKNHQHYKKLEEDRRKFKGKYSILVSELEKEESSFLLKRVTDFQDMYVVRPQYIMSIISIIYNFEIASKKVLKDKVHFEKSEKILTEFEKMKTDLIDNSIKQTKTKLEKIIKDANTIKEKANSILDTSNIALGKGNLSTIISKLEDFNIKKIIKEIDKVEDK